MWNKNLVYEEKRTIKKKVKKSPKKNRIVFAPLRGKIVKVKVKKLTAKKVIYYV